MKKQLFILMAVVLLMSGCGSSKRVVLKPKELPSWYMHPPLSTDTVLYGVGDGKEKQEAISDALTLILSTLNISISSKYSVKSIVKEGTFQNSSDSTYVNETQSEVRKISVSNYEVIQSEKLGWKHYAVLIKVDKAKFFQGLHKELEQKFQIIETQEKNIVLKNAIEQLAFYKKSLDTLNDLQNRLAVMSTLRSSFDPAIFLNRYEHLQQKYDKLLHSISFWVQADYKPLISPIAKGLSAKKFLIKQRRNNNHFTVFVHADIKRATAYGFTLARANISIKTKDIHANIVGENSFNLVGKSSQGYGIAKQDLVKKLNYLIAKEGIAKVLNLDIY